MPARAQLTLDRVLDAAVEMADERGLAALTMRSLAAEVHVEAMSLYHHVRNKDALLAGILDRVMGEVSLEAGDGWRASVRGVALSTYAALACHPWAALPLLSGSAPVPARMRQMDALLGFLRSGGFSLEASELAYHALDSHIMGFTLWGTGVSAGLQEFRANPEPFLQRMNLAEHHYVAEHIDLHRRGGTASAETTFTFVLDLVLEGLERLRVA